MSATDKFAEVDAVLCVLPEPLPLMEDTAFATLPIANPAISSDSTGCSTINLPTVFSPFTKALFVFLGATLCGFGILDLLLFVCISTVSFDELPVLLAVSLSSIFFLL